MTSTAWRLETCIQCGRPASAPAAMERTCEGCRLRNGRGVDALLAAVELLLRVDLEQLASGALLWPGRLEQRHAIARIDLAELAAAAAPLRELGREVMTARDALRGVSGALERLRAEPLTSVTTQLVRIKSTARRGPHRARCATATTKSRQRRTAT